MLSYRTLVPLTALMLALPACGGSGGGSSGNPAAPPPPTIVEVEVLDFSYSPKRLQIESGTTVRFVHRGADPDHTVTSMGNRFDSGFAFRNQGDTFEVTFQGGDVDQTFEYSCVSHEACCRMRGSIRVGANAPAPQPGY